GGQAVGRVGVGDEAERLAGGWILDRKPPAVRCGPPATCDQEVPGRQVQGVCNRVPRARASGTLLRGHRVERTPEDPGGHHSPRPEGGGGGGSRGERWSAV